MDETTFILFCLLAFLNLMEFILFAWCFKIVHERMKKIVSKVENGNLYK